MKVEDKENINVILLKHKGKNTKFKCFVEPFPYEKRLDLIDEKSIEITFDDLMEVQALIDVLERFKRKTQEYIGTWEEVR